MRIFDGNYRIKYVDDLVKPRTAPNKQIARVRVKKADAVHSSQPLLMLGIASILLQGSPLVAPMISIGSDRLLQQALRDIESSLRHRIS